MKIKFPSFFKKNKLEDTNTNFDKELEQFVAKRISADDLNGNALSHENELLKNTEQINIIIKENKYQNSTKNFR